MEAGLLTAPTTACQGADTRPPMGTIPVRTDARASTGTAPLRVPTGDEPTGRTLEAAR